MLRKLKIVLEKDDFDYSEGLIDPYKFHKYFYWFSKAFLIIDNEPLDKVFSIIHLLCVTNSLFAIFVILVSGYKAFETMDIIVITQIFSYLIVLIYSAMIFISVKTDLPHYHALQRAVRRDFYYICTEGHKYRDRFFKSQIITWKLTTACFSLPLLASIVAFSTILFLAYYFLTRDANDENDTGRPLLFPIWMFNLDIKATPYYEFFFSWTIWTIIMIGYVYAFMTQTEVTWVRQITQEADIIIYLIEDLMEGIYPTKDQEELKHFDCQLKTRFREILRRHHDMYTLLDGFANVYRKMLLYEQKLGGPVLCMCAYVTTELYSVKGELNPVLFILFMATLNVVVIPCYMCTYLAEKIRSVSDACWNIRFWDASAVIRPYLVIITQRSLRRLPLQAPGFDEVSLQTFSSKMSSAYSMFNMLRQTNIGNIN